MIDFLVIGSGPAGAAAALALRGSDCVVIDPGFVPEQKTRLCGDLFALRQSNEDLFSELIGDDFEALYNLHNPPMSLKLKAPAMRYIVRQQEELCPVQPGNFEATVSFAMGGLANAWGAGVYRFSPDDLSAFPIDASALKAYYDEIGAIMGIAGANDDLAPWFGADEMAMLPPVRLSQYFQDLLRAYARRREWVNAQGIYLGRSRLAVLTQPYRGRPAYAYDNLDFFQPWNPSVYNPAFTVKDLADSNLIKYESGLLATSWREHEDHVEVAVRALRSQTTHTLRARHVIVAAGAINSARLALVSRGDLVTRLPIMDNAITAIPIVRPGRIGVARDPLDSPIGQVNMIYSGVGSKEPVQATLYGTSGPMRSDVLLNFPLPLQSSLQCAKLLTPALAFVMLFYPDAPTNSNYLRLTDAGALWITHDGPKRGEVERRVIRAFRGLGYLSSKRICQFPRIGAGLHYAGCLPMKAQPGPYETNPHGLLFGSRRLYFVDGAVFPKLPAKNLTYTIMANAMRVATNLRQQR